jgi:hypothetical protein
MENKFMTVVFVLALVAGFAASVPASSAQSGDLHGTGALHMTKECSAYTGAAGDYCTITSSNLAAIEAGSRVYYGQAANFALGLVDSNVVLDTGNGKDRAVGRCTLDLVTGLGLCTFSDGTGQFTGFQARVNVSPPTDGANWHWDGTYHFSSEPSK